MNAERNENGREKREYSNFYPSKWECGYNGRISLLEQNVKTGHGRRVVFSTVLAFTEKLRDFSLI